MKNIHRAVLACTLSLCTAAGAVAPPTFGIEVGNALLCLNQLNSKYFFDYLQAAFGPPYKTEGGAYWFKADSSIWGLQITDVMVNDPSSPADFIGAVVNATPQKVAEAISSSIGIRFTLTDATTYSLRESQAGSKIAYADTKAKIYCAKSKFLVPGKS